MATLAELDALVDANPDAFGAIAASYEVLIGGVPNINGFVFLINTAVSTNFGSNNPSIVFNQENIFINIANALVQLNPTARANFEAITAGSASLEDRLNALYSAFVPVNSQTAEGRAFFTRPDAQAFYTSVAAQRGVAGADGPAIVGLAALLNILVNDDLGIGDDVNDLRAAIDDGSAVLPTTGSVFTPIETADGTNFDADDTDSALGQTFVLTTANGESLGGTIGNDIYDAILGAGQTFNPFDVINDVGGANDTLRILSDGTVVTLPVTDAVQGVENIDFVFTANPVGTIDASQFVGATRISMNTHAAAVSNINGQVIAVNGATLEATDVFTVDTGVSSLAVELNNVATGAIVNGNEEAAGSLTSLSVFGSVAGAGSLVIQSNATALESLTLGIASNSTVDVFNLLPKTTFTTIDASASTGNLTMNVDNNNNFLTDIRFGEGNDVLNQYDIFGANGGAGGISTTIDMGAGDDDLFVQLDGQTSNTLLTITLGGGSDLLRIQFDFNNILDASAANFASGLVIVTDMSVIEDTLDVSTFGVRDVLSNVELADVADEASLYDAVTLAATFTTAAGLSAFDFGGSAYVFNDTDASGTFSNGDGLIQLTGVAVSELNGANFLTA